jgi:succinoglycan biosynthesis protein ExoM
MRSHLVRADGLALRFDEAMRFTGGSDSDFFFRAADHGAVIRWVDDAWVREVVGPSRISINWEWMRALRVAANNSTIYRKRRGLGEACVRCLPKAFLRFVQGSVVAGFGALVFIFVRKRGLKWFVRGGKDLASGVGGVMGLADISFQPYRITN